MKVMRTLGRVPRNANPSQSARNPRGRVCPSATGSGGIGPRDVRPAIAASVRNASTVYALGNPNAWMRNPASSGPTVSAEFIAKTDSAFAAGSCSRVRIRG